MKCNLCWYIWRRTAWIQLLTLGVRCTRVDPIERPKLSGIFSSKKSALNESSPADGDEDIMHEGIRVLQALTYCRDKQTE